MYLIQEILVSAEVFNRKFICNLDKCRGACCWEGDFGAPVEEDEKVPIQQSLEAVKLYLSDANLQRIQEKGAFSFNAEYGGDVTSLMNDGSCVFLYKDQLGHAVCSFEKAFHEGKSTFRKPVSCHLYPLRVKKNALSGFEAINYDEWDICSPACTLGEEMSMPVFRFVKEALIRAYGQDFYDELESVYEQIIAQK